MRELHLICNAHLDPIWLWPWEEGAGAALSTFRTAADLCEEFDGFVFNHNEAILYRWVEEYEPELFERIRRLVRDGRWHIMGGWYLQPDCNLPSGEAFVRQVQMGLHYFEEKFGVRPAVAINFDSFGHSRGLVQILTQLGYRGYMHTRPTTREIDLPSDYRWRGLDGSTLVMHREDSYNSRMGQAREHVQTWLEAHPDSPVGALLWGVGNHGGGPSRRDLRDIAELQTTSTDVRILHSTPEAYIGRLDAESLPVVERSLRPCFVGCYTSQVRIKQAYRALENDLFLAEKMCSHAAIAGRLEYPEEELNEACRDMLFAQFHDVIAGSSIQLAEEASLRLMHHGQEILSRVKARAFFALARSEAPAAEGEIPILVYNPHPFPVDHVVDAEYQLQDVDLNNVYMQPHVTFNGEAIPYQAEREVSNVPAEFRKRVVFHATLPPSQMSRFSCTVTRADEKPAPNAPKDGPFSVVTDRLSVVISRETGLIDHYSVDGVEFLRQGAFLPVVRDDDDDSWANEVGRFDRDAGAFELMSPAEAGAFVAIGGDPVPPVRVVEDGPVRTVIQALFRYSASRLCQTYFIPKQGTETGIECRVYWNEQHKMLKLSVPTMLDSPKLLGQTAYGVEQLPTDGEETIAQKWCALADDARAFTCINDGSYGLDSIDGTLRLSLLRSPGYSALPFLGRQPMPDGRFSPRIDQGERVFRFWCNGGTVNDRFTRVDREALVHNEKPMVMSYFPPGAGRPCVPLATLDDDAIQLTATKKSHTSDNYVLRVFEPTGRPRQAILRVPLFDLEWAIALGAHEIKTYRLDIKARQISEIPSLPI